MTGSIIRRWSAAFAAALMMCMSAAEAGTPPSAALYADHSDGRDWPGYGRTFGHQHYSPLRQIDARTVGGLQLAWSLDLEPLHNTATEPIEVGGVLYFATGLSVVHAVDAASGRLLWRYDPRAAEQAGINLRNGWGVRGIAWWNGKVYTGTVDGRLIAIDANTGRLVWSVQTFKPGRSYTVSGAPLACNGEILIGFGGTVGYSRGYVTAYDAESGKRLWRFYTVPGNPAKGFENQAMAMAAKTWAGKWWDRGGGGGDVWNSMAYDPDSDTVFIGTGNGYAANRQVRSDNWGDNLFISSVVALDRRTGALKWYYQTTPGDTWDFDAIEDIEFTDVTIGGKTRKVLMQAPKNGFFYVIDRTTGRLISARPYAKVTWASRIDPQTGRPIVIAADRFPNKTVAEVWPTGYGAHNWMPMAYSPQTGLAYIPKIENGVTYTDRGIDLPDWRPPTNDTSDFAINFGLVPGVAPRGALVAWNPVTQTAAWSVPQPTYANGGILATAGDLVFEGTIDGTFKAYDARTGKVLWSFDAQAPIMGTPISYTVNGMQYVTVLTGLGMGLAGEIGAYPYAWAGKYRLDPRSQARRVLTFALNGSARLPATPYEPQPAVQDADFRQDQAASLAGEDIYDPNCAQCHGADAIADIQAPDLRRSAVILSAEAFRIVVHGGARKTNGMPVFPELSDRQLADLRQFLRAQAAKLRHTEARMRGDRSYYPN